MRAHGPELCDGCADGGVVLAGVGVDVARVGNLALGRRVDAVNLGAGERAEAGNTEFLSQGVDARVLQQLCAVRIDFGSRGILLEGARTGDLAGEVLSRVEELEEASDRVKVFTDELNLTRLLRMKSVSSGEKQNAPGEWRNLGGTLTLPSSLNWAHASLKKGLCTRSA